MVSDEIVRKRVKILAWVTLSIVAFCGIGYFAFMDMITPPPDKPTDVPNGSSVAAIGKLYPGKYTAYKTTYRDARSLTRQDRKNFNGAIHLDDGEIDSKQPVIFENGKRTDSDRTTLDAFIRKQNPNRVIKYQHDQDSFEIELPKEAEKLKDFTGTLQLPVEDHYFYLYFDLRHGSVIKSMKHASLAWG